MSDNQATYQLYFRETREVAHEAPIYVMVGVVEAPKGTLTHNTQATLIPSAENGEAILQAVYPVDDGVNIEERFPDCISSGFGVDDFFRSRGWPLNGAVDCGSLIYKSVQMPVTSPDKEGFAVFGLMATKRIDIDLDHIHVFQGEIGHKHGMQLTGFLGGNLNPEWKTPGMLRAGRGFTHGQLLQLPLWGFGVDPVMLPSLVEPSVLKTWSEARIRIARGEELADLDPELRRKLLNTAGCHVYSDESYRDVLRIIYEENPEFLNVEYSARTAAQEAQREAVMKAAVREMMTRKQLMETGLKI